MSNFYPSKTLRQFTLPAVAACAAIMAMPAQAAPSSIEGQWKAGDGKSIISVYKCGAAYCGKITRILVKEPAGGARDTNNPKASLRSRKLVGTRILWNLKANGNSYSGKGYSPEDGRYFNATISRSGSRLNIKGCVMVFCRNLTFTRV